MGKVVPPPILYKYCTFDGAHATFQNSAFRFTPLVEFNDPYEFMPAQTDLSADTDIILEHMLRTKGSEYSEQEKAKILSCLSSDEVRQHLLKQLKDGNYNILSAAKAFVSSYLACCFSEHNNSLLMWAHYAQQHQGICIAVETAQSMIYQQVIYQKERPRLSFSEDPKTFQRLLYTKSIDWAYEKEWRILLQKEDTVARFEEGKYLVPIKKSGIKAIYFGLRTPVAQKEKLKKLLPPSVKFYHAQEHPVEYELVFAEDTSF